MKKLLSILLMLALLVTAVAATPSAASEQATAATGSVSELEPYALYACTVPGSEDVQDWVRWNGVDGVYYLTLPASLKGETVALYNAYAEEVSLGGVNAAANTVFEFTPAEGTEYLFRQDRTTRTVMFAYEEVTPVYALRSHALYAHASRGSKDTQAWVRWYGVDGTYYLFLPNSVKRGEPVELYNAYPEEVSLDGKAIAANTVFDFTPEEGTEYLFRQGRTTRNVAFMYSDAESALFVNNNDDFDGMDFLAYLQEDKSHSVSALGAYTHANGTVSDVEIKKMKGRGNTSWEADKKGFNVTFTDAIELAGMEKCKKFSLISNFQDAAMARSRILYDLSDAVGVPYASDSRMIDLYTNGIYQGTYQMCQKIEVGKNSLMPDIDANDYLDPETGGVKKDFSFVVEIDTSPAADDFHFSVQNGNGLTVKSPEPEAGDANIPAIRGYIKNKYNAMFSKLNSGSDDVGELIDLDSLAKVYLINELGKNWDGGASSFFLTYKPDENGTYKFFASPVWDFDNTLGNANGIARDLQNMGISDYTLPSGWFSTKKNGYSGPNFLATAAKNSAVMQTVYRVWFEDFVPALSVLTKEGAASGELYSADVYRKILKASAEMNYKVWPIVTNTRWIADHSKLQQWGVTYTYDASGRITGADAQPFRGVTEYDQDTFDGQFDYMMDWTLSRAAWISGQYIAEYALTDPVQPTEPPTEPPTEAPTEAPTEPAVLPYPAPALSREHLIAMWSFDDAGKTEGDKLSEYGTADGYAATTGEGTLTLSVSGDKARALEWSAAEYGPSGKSMTPLMAAGSKNQWGAPYIQLEVNTEGQSDLALTLYLAGSKKAPASWKLQLSADGESFTDADGAVLTITADQRKELTAYFNRLALPSSAEGLSTLYLRLVPVSMDTVEGGNTADKPSGGEIALNYIAVYGLPADVGADILGDVNLNGAVDILDATMIQRHLAALDTLSERQQKVADTNHSGEVDILDATMIQRYLAALITEF